VQRFPLEWPQCHFSLPVTRHSVLLLDPRSPLPAGRSLAITISRFMVMPEANELLAGTDDPKK
jgi:hypothetical protein